MLVKFLPKILGCSNTQRPWNENRGASTSRYVERRFVIVDRTVFQCGASSDWGRRHSWAAVNASDDVRADIWWTARSTKKFRRGLLCSPVTWLALRADMAHHLSAARRLVVNSSTSGGVYIST